MRLLLTCHRDPFLYIGGSEEVVKQLALRLARLGHQVLVVTNQAPGAHPTGGIYDAQTGDWLPFTAGQREAVSVLGFESNGRGPLVTNQKLSHFIGYGGTDAVLLYGQNTWLTDEIWRDVGDRWRSHYFQGRIVYVPVGFLNLERPSGVWRQPRLARVVWWLYYNVVQKHIIEQSDVTVALTDHEMGAIQRLARPRQLAKIPNGVDCALFQDDHDDAVLDRYQIERPFVLNVGGDYENKRLADACLGVRELNKQRAQKLQLVLAGPNTEHYSNSWVRGLGVVSDSDKVALYHEAECVLQTSDFEGYGLTLLEALAAGVPFASTRVGAAEELALQFGGTLIHMHTPASIAYHLSQELEMERDPAELRAVAARYDWSIIVKLVEDVCKAPQ